MTSVMTSVNVYKDVSVPCSYFLIIAQFQSTKSDNVLRRKTEDQYNTTCSYQTICNPVRSAKQYVRLGYIRIIVCAGSIKQMDCNLILWQLLLQQFTLLTLATHNNIFLHCLYRNYQFTIKPCTSLLVTLYLLLRCYKLEEISEGVRTQLLL